MFFCKNGLTIEIEDDKKEYPYLLLLFPLYIL